MAVPCFQPLQDLESVFASESVHCDSRLDCLRGAKRDVENKRKAECPPGVQGCGPESPC